MCGVTISALIHTRVDNEVNQRVMVVYSFLSDVIDVLTLPLKT